mgnify:CR=1 FL=1
MELQKLYHKDKLIRIFYKYYNSDTENIVWLTVTPYEDVSGLIYMVESIDEEFNSEWNYESFMRNLLNTNK